MEQRDGCVKWPAYYCMAWRFVVVVFQGVNEIQGSVFAEFNCIVFLLLF